VLGLLPGVEHDPGGPPHAGAHPVDGADSRRECGEYTLPPRRNGAQQGFVQPDSLPVRDPPDGRGFEHLGRGDQDHRRGGIRAPPVAPARSMIT
jgi:hypothetical protein